MADLNPRSLNILKTKPLSAAQFFAFGRWYNGADDTTSCDKNSILLDTISDGMAHEDGESSSGMSNQQFTHVFKTALVGEQIGERPGELHILWNDGRSFWQSPHH
jgi:hypothetical protein